MSTKGFIYKDIKMLRAVKGYEMFVKLADNEIYAYDIDSETRMLDYSTVGILKSVDEEFAKAICEALDVDSIEDYGVEVQQNNDSLGQKIGG